jgi:hypothetical protein
VRDETICHDDADLFQCLLEYLSFALRHHSAGRVNPPVGLVAVVLLYKSPSLPQNIKGTNAATTAFRDERIVLT